MVLSRSVARRAPNSQRVSVSAACGDHDAMQIYWLKPLPPTLFKALVVVVVVVMVVVVVVIVVVIVGPVPATVRVSCAGIVDTLYSY